MDRMHLLFQYCPKLVVMNHDKTRVLLCKRKGEADYDGVFSLIGGKMEHTDANIIEALRREKSEEVGTGFHIRVLPYPSIDVYFKKSDGMHMILPHFYAEHLSGDIILSDEYSEWRWVLVDELPRFAPKIENVSWITPRLMILGKEANPHEFVEI